jgi:hypothetical protein
MSDDIGDSWEQTLGHACTVVAWLVIPFVLLLLSGVLLWVF